jgi:hypothetical protein
MKQTAVEWLEIRAEERKKYYPNESAVWCLNQLIMDFEQAKGMEKQQHRKTWFESASQFDNASEMTHIEGFEQYYNEKIKKK